MRYTLPLQYTSCCCMKLLGACLVVHLIATICKRVKHPAFPFRLSRREALADKFICGCVEYNIRRSPALRDQIIAP
jgi:hypothetical protein